MPFQKVGLATGIPIMFHPGLRVMVNLPPSWKVVTLFEALVLPARSVMDTSRSA